MTWAKVTDLVKEVEVDNAAINANTLISDEPEGEVASGIHIEGRFDRQRHASGCAVEQPLWLQLGCDEQRAFRSYQRHRQQLCRR